jgi:hypothetical protein
MYIFDENGEGCKKRESESLTRQLGVNAGQGKTPLQTLTVPMRIVFDIDNISDSAHGGRQLALLTDNYDDYYFQPIPFLDAATGKSILSLLRPGKRPSGEGAAWILRLAICRIRSNRPRVEITLCGDGHCGTPEIFPKPGHSPDTAWT